MSDGALPHWVNTRKAVGREAHYSGTLGPDQLSEFASYLEPESGSAVRAEIRFGRDDDARSVVDVTLNARVQLECQRCLGSLARELHSVSRLALVPSDEHARHLPESYEPLIAGEETDLWAVVAEELALALPVVAYHAPGECATALAGSGEPQQEQAVGDAQRANPFDVLSVLLEQPASDADEKSE